MKPSNSNSGEETPKSTQSKINKKSTKPRSKSSKSAELSNNAAKNISMGGASASGNNIINSNSMLATTPTTPTTTNSGNLFESALATGAGIGGTSGGASTDANSNSRNHHKNYVGLEPRSIKIIWEQHDQSDVELSAEVCARMAEDASYKLWELINSVKTYARHSGGVVTYDLVNEVLRDADVPPALGAMDSDWERIDYDGSYYFYSDKIIELREEYQKDVTINMPYGAEFSCAWPVEDKTAELLKKYIPSLIYVILHGNGAALESALEETAIAPIIGSCYRVILAKIIQILAFKQNESVSTRCWRLLRALAVNPCTRDVSCRQEYFHLAEILVCQLLAPYESIKVHNNSNRKQGEEEEQQTQQSHAQTIKMEIEEIKLEQQMDMKTELIEQEQPHTHGQGQDTFHTPSNTEVENIFKLQTDEDDDDVNMLDQQQEHEHQMQMTSPYFASPVDWKHVDELCETIGHSAAISGYFQSECLFHILRRLERFFEGRQLNSEREYNFVSRAVRGLISLGEHAFREFIPFVYKFKADDVPELLWSDFAPAAVFLNGPDDLFLYEWLEFLCGADKLQPFMGYYADYHEKLLIMRFLKRKLSTFKINSKVAVRRLEWSTLAAAMCHGDDPNRALKPKPTLQEVFPELVVPNLNLNRAGNIRFKFAGCRPVIIKPKITSTASQNKSKTDTITPPASGSSAGAGSTHNDIFIARRKLLKPLTNERRVLSLSSYCFVRI